MYNIKENKKNNRWYYSAKPDKKKFVSLMYILSLSVLIEFIIFETLPLFIYNFLLYDIGIYQSDFIYIFSPDELYYITVNIATIILTLIASAITVVFLNFCLRNFNSAQNSNVLTSYDKISFKFKLPKNTFALLIVGLCIIQLSLFISEFLNKILNYFFDITRSSLYDFMYFPETLFGAVLYFVTIVIMPAFIEEYIFRYIMLNALKKYGHVFAIITTAVLFGFLHARTSAFFYATAIGFFSAYIAIKTKSIWFSIILHAVVNANSFIFQYIAVQPFTDFVYNMIYFIFINVISIIALIYLIILIIKKKNLKLSSPVNYIHIENRRKIVFFFNAASVIFFILVILKSAEEYGFVNISNIHM